MLFEYSEIHCQIIKLGSLWNVLDIRRGNSTVANVNRLCLHIATL